jgi:4-hydroxy-2-oxoheptanedioate aldolase
MRHRGIITGTAAAERSAVSVEAPESSFRSRILARETLLGTFVSAGSAVIAELCARVGFDWLVVDLEHGAGTESDLVGQLHAIGDRTAAIVRPPSAERLRVGRALDLGAHGIMVPRLEREDEVREALSFMRFPPDGARGVALMSRGAGFGEVMHAGVASLNGPLVGVFQVESPLAVANARAVAAIDGVDVLFVGPSDLSHSMGMPGRFSEPQFDEALRSVVAAAEASGKAAGILLRSITDLDRHLDLGFRFIGIGSDLNFVVDGARATIGAAREAVRRRGSGYSSASRTAG